MPRTGLNVPVITVLDDAGGIIEADQRRAVRYLIQSGSGADSILIAGTTGEFKQLTNTQRQRLIEIVVDEIRKVNASLPPPARVEAWAGVTAPTKQETFENLELAMQLGADMAVIAPMTINNLDKREIVQFFERDVARLLGSSNSMPVGLYDNPDIAADPAASLMPLPVVEALSRLPFVVGVKASTSRESIRNYVRAFARDGRPGGFDVYVGNAPLIFEMDEIQREAGVSAGKLAAAGVVAGTANLLPREWKQAWQVVRKRDQELSRTFQNVLSAVDQACIFTEGGNGVVKLIAGIKHGMYVRRIISSPCVGRETPGLTEEQAEVLTDRLTQLADELRNRVGSQCLSIDEV